MTGPRTALVVRGGWDGHAPVEATELFVPMLRANGFDVTISDSLASYTDTGLLAATDLIVQCWSWGELAAAELDGLRNAVANGTGLAGWHGGILDTARASPGYLQLVGGQFAEHPGGIKPFVVTVRDDARDHPIVEGIDTIRVESEQYWVLSDSHNVVLAETTHSGVGEPWGEPVTVPAIWTRQWGQGRIFVSMIGHSVADFDVPEVRTITERGILWASRSKTVLDRP